MTHEAGIPRLTLRRWILTLALAALGVAVWAGVAAGRLPFGTFGEGIPEPPPSVVLLLLVSGSLLASLLGGGRTATRRMALVPAVPVVLVSLGTLGLAAVSGRAVPMVGSWILQGLRGVPIPVAAAMLGAALSILLRWHRAAPSWLQRQASAVLALVPLGLSLLATAGYAAGMPRLYDLQRLPMSLSALVCAFLAGSALVLAAGEDTWPLALFRTIRMESDSAEESWFALGPLALFGLLALGILTAGALYLRGQIRSDREGARRQVAAVADLKVRQIAGWYRERRQDGEQILHGGLIQSQLARFLAGGPQAPSAAEIRGWMENLRHRTYQRIVLFDAKGQVRLSVPPAGGAREDGGKVPGEVDLARVQEALRAKDILFQDLHRDPGRTRIHMGLWIPIVSNRRPDGPAPGVLLLLLDPQQFLYPLIQNWPTPSPSAETLLVRREGADVLFLNEVRHREGTALILKSPLGTGSRLPAALAVGGREGYCEGVDYRGVPVLAALRHVPGTPWFLVSKVDEAEIFGPARARVWAVDGALLGLLVVVALSMGLMVRHREAGQVRARIRLEREKRVLSDRYAYLMEQAGDIILVLDTEGRILEANTQAQAHYGHSLDEIRGMTARDLRVPETRGEFQAQYAQVRAGLPLRFETLHLRADGTTFPVEVSAKRVEVGDRSVILSFIRDITERRKQEREIQRISRLYAALSQVNQAIVWSPTREALLEKICEVMVTFGGFSMAWIGWEDPGTHRVAVAAQYGDVWGILSRVVVRSDDTPEGHGPLGTAIREGRPGLLNDYVGASESAPWREELVASGLASIAAFPIRVGGVVRGALAVYAKEKGFFGEPETALLEEAAMDISFSLDNLAREEGRREAEAALQESERFLRAAQEAGGIGTYMWHIPEDRWRSSAHLDRIFGIDDSYPRDMKGWSDLVAPEFRDRMRTYVAGILERREPFDLEYPILRASDGARRWVHGTGELQWNEAGLPLALTGVIRDITDEKKAEAALRASEEKFSKAFHASPDAVSINRVSDGAYLAVNEGFSRTTGFAPREVLGRSPRPGQLGLWVRDEDVARLLEGLEREGQVIGLEAPFRRKDGTVLTILMSASQIDIEDEPCVLSVTRDITELRAQARQLERMTQMYAALSQVNQAIVWSPTLEALLGKICEVMVEFGKFSMAWIGWHDPATHEVRVAARCGDVNGYLDGLQVRSDDTPLGQGPTGRSIREGRPCVVNNFLDASRTAPWHEAAVQSGYQAMAAFPIRQGGEVRGALMVYSREAEFFGIPETSLLEEAAGDVSFALDHLELDARRQLAEDALQESERRFRTLTDTMAGAVFVYQGERFIFANPAFQRLTGYEPEANPGLRIQDLIHPEDWPLVKERARARLRGEAADPRYDFRILRKDGEVRWMDFTAGTVQWEGRPAGVGTAYDITDRKRAENEVRELWQTVEQSPLSIIITSLDGTIRYVNPAFTRVTGYQSSEAVGQTPRILKSPATPGEVHRQMWEALQRGDVWVGELENLRKDGAPFHERATIAPVRDANGTITNYIALKEDITAQRRAEEERRVMEAQLYQSQKLESLGSLAGGVAHDMNNVLGAILSLASTLREKAGPSDPAAKSLDTIMNACTRGRGVVKSLLYFAHKDLQEDRPVDLNALVQEMSQLLSYTTLKRIHLEMDLQPDLGYLRGDAGALSHALMNLCVNACDAMPSGGMLRIQTARTSAGGVTLRVQDTGEGMPPEVLAKCMEPFFTTKGHGHGTGLGLSMVYGTMKAHDGVIELRSQVGRGTEAVLGFPASRLVPAPPAEAPLPEPRPAGARRLKVLLIDDDELIRESVVSVLEILGHDAIPVPGGPDGLRLLEEGAQVDLVILDMNMPGMSGAQVLPLILALRPSITVLMATGYSDEEIAPLMVGRPRVHSLRKPFSMRELERKISELRL